jgi:hypothetical protein
MQIAIALMTMAKKYIFKPNKNTTHLKILLSGMLAVANMYAVQDDFICTPTPKSLGKLRMHHSTKTYQLNDQRTLN